MPLPTAGPSTSLSNVTSTLIQSLPNIFERLRELEAEERLLDAKTETLTVQRDKGKATHPTSALHRAVVTPTFQRRRPAVAATADKENHACHDETREAKTPKTPKNVFMFKDALSATMSVRSKRKGRIFVLDFDDTSEALARRRNLELLSMLP